MLRVFFVIQLGFVLGLLLHAFTCCQLWGFAVFEMKFVIAIAVPSFAFIAIIGRKFVGFNVRVTPEHSGTYDKSESWSSVTRIFGG